MAQVIGQIEIGVVRPPGGTEAGGRLDHPLAQADELPTRALEGVDEVLPRRGRVEQVDRGQRRAPSGIALAAEEQLVERRHRLVAVVRRGWRSTARLVRPPSGGRPSPAGAGRLCHGIRRPRKPGTSASYCRGSSRETEVRPRIRAGRTNPRHAASAGRRSVTGGTAWAAGFAACGAARAFLGSADAGGVPLRHEGSLPCPREVSTSRARASSKAAPSGPCSARASHRPRIA